MRVRTTYMPSFGSESEPDLRTISLSADALGARRGNVINPRVYSTLYTVRTQKVQRRR